MTKFGERCQRVRRRCRLGHEGSAISGVLAALRAEQPRPRRDNPRCGPRNETQIRTPEFQTSPAARRGGPLARRIELSCLSPGDRGTDNSADGGSVLTESPTRIVPGTMTRALTPRNCRARPVGEFTN